jgi:2-dehydro-3-deoxygluconokinase
MSTVLCMGEVLLRLAAPGRELLLQAPRLETSIGGAEANVAISLAKFGHAVRMLSVLPTGTLGDAVMGELRRHGLDVEQVRRNAGRMGLYFLSTGALHRPSEVIYDRAASAFACAIPSEFDWPLALQGVSRLHLSGVTPALGANGATLALHACEQAALAGVPIAFDGNFRGKLWETSGVDPAPILHALFARADVLFADHRDLALVLGNSYRQSDEPQALFTTAAHAAFQAFPNLQRIATTSRIQHSVDHHSMCAFLCTRNGAVHRTRGFELPGIIDRIGAGDAFAAGVLHGLISGQSDANAAEFGIAACALKHSVPGDFNLLRKEAVLALMDGAGFHVRR